jgi:hypothetical protein
MAVVHERGPMAVAGGAVEVVTHVGAHHAATAATEHEIYLASITRIFREGSTEMLHSSTFQNILVKNKALHRGVARKLVGTGTAGVAELFCAGAEFHEIYEQLVHDWNAGTPNAVPEHGHEENTSEGHAHHSVARG